jgi:uncharacterized phage infection (PIP) family protein YhgE
MSDEDAKRLWVSRVLGIQFPDQDDDGPVTKEEMADRLREIRDLAGQSGGLDQIVAQFREVAEAVRDRGADAQEELEILERHVADVNETHADKELAGETDLLTRDADRDDTKLNRIRTALTSVRAEVQLAAATLSEAASAYAQALKASKEQQQLLSGDEDEIIAAAKSAGDAVPPFDETADAIETLLEEYEAAEDAPGASQILAEAEQAVAAYRQGLTDPLLTEMQETDAGSYQIMSAIEEALGELEQALKSS